MVIDRRHVVTFTLFAVALVPLAADPPIAADASTTNLTLPLDNPVRLAQRMAVPFANPKRSQHPDAIAEVLKAKQVQPRDASLARTIGSHEKAIAPVMRGLPGKADLAKVKEAILAYKKGKTERAAAAARGIQNKTARKLVRWYAYRSGNSEASAQTIAGFIRKNHDWPIRRLQTTAEHALLKSSISAQEVIRFFKDKPPKTGAGQAALAAALAATGDRAQAKRLASAAWRNNRLDKSTEAAILGKVGNLLSAADHKWRVDRFLLKDSRWRGTRKSRAAQARRAAKHLSKAERKKIEARIAVYTRSRRATKLYGKLPKGAMKDWGVYFQKIQLLRRRKKDRAAWKLLLAAPTDPKLVVSPDDWWIERRVNAYRALYHKQPRTAYKLVADPGPVSVNPRNEASFMAGWIALRFLRDAKTAERHFRAFTKTADGPRTRSTSAYWLGRTLEALDRRKEANQQYRNATSYFNTFYGQLARQRLDSSSKLIRIAPPPIPSDDVVARFRARDVIKAAVIANKADLNNVMRAILTELRYRLKDPRELVLLAEVAKTIGDTQMSVRIGKTGMARGQNLVNYAYPTHAMPKYKPLRSPPERAILFAIARQESEFNTLIQSGAGARGILQVMPVTAKHICRQYKIRCSIKALKANPSYNAKLASAYIADRKDDFAGSYIMTFAGYNAGPGRVRYWVRNNGDPRHAKVDPIDWIELIHIKETRDYVKKVMANVQVYRSRLGQEETALRINNDIMRARRGARSASN